MALACALALAGCGGNTRVSSAVPSTTPEIAPVHEAKDEAGGGGTTTTAAGGNQETPEEEVEGATEGEAPVTEAPEEEVPVEEAPEVPEEEVPVSEPELEGGGTEAEEAPAAGGAEEAEEVPTEEAGLTGGAGAP